MDTVTLNATRRTVTGKAVNRLRRAGTIPAVVYGHNQEPISLTVDQRTFQKVYSQAGESTLISLVVEGVGELRTLIKEVQHHPLSDLPTHIDFQKVSLTEKLETTIPVEIVGVSPAVKDLGGVLVHNMTELNVRCLPTDLVHNFTLDISTLVEYGTMLTVKDVVIPKGIEVLDELDAPVVSVVAPKAEEAPSTPTEEGATPAEVEVLKQKTPEEVAAEAAAGGDKKGGDKGKKE